MACSGWRRREREWSASSTARHGDRCVHSLGSGPASRRTLSRREGQGGAVTVGYVAAPVPPLAVPLLASAAGESVDHSTLQFLLGHAIKTQKVLEEEEERRKKVEEAVVLHAGEPLSAAEHEAWYGTSSSSAWKEEEEEEDEEEKAPEGRVLIFSPGCERPYDHASDPVHPQTRGLPVVAQRQAPTVHTFQVQFLDMVLDMPVVVLRQVPDSMLQKTGVVPQLQFIDGRRLFFRAAETDFHGPDYSAAHGVSPVAVRFRVVDAPVVQVVLAMPVVVNDRCAGSDLQNPVEVPQKQYSDKVVDAPVVRSSWCRRCSSALLWTPL